MDRNRRVQFAETLAGRAAGGGTSGHLPVTVQATMRLDDPGGRSRRTIRPRFTDTVPDETGRSGRNESGSRIVPADDLLNDHRMIAGMTEKTIKAMVCRVV